MANVPIMKNSRQLETLSIAVGSTLHAWSVVEVEVSHLFMIMHSRAWNDFSHPLRAAFEAVISFEARLGMIKASVAADADIPEAYEVLFNALHKKLIKSYRKRHEIAHFMFVGRDCKDGSEYFLRPFFRWEAFEKNKGVELNEKQIMERRDSFIRLIERVMQHRQNIGKLKGLSAEFYAQAGDPAFPDLLTPSADPEEPALSLEP